MIENILQNGEIVEPATPEIITGHKWNGTVYGEKGRYSIYLNREKVEVSDSEAEGLKQYAADKETYQNLSRAKDLGILEEYIEAFEEKQAEINKITKPVVPEKIKGIKWNETVYGKNGNYSIYVNGTKIMISDFEAEEIRQYLSDRQAYDDRVELFEKNFRLCYF